MFRNVTPQNHSLCSFYFQYILWKLMNQHTQWYESERMARFDKHCRLFSNCGHLYATEHFLWFIILFFIIWNNIFSVSSCIQGWYFQYRSHLNYSHSMTHCFVNLYIYSAGKQSFVQEHIQAHSNDTIKTLRYWPYVLGLPEQRASNVVSVRHSPHHDRYGTCVIRHHRNHTRILNGVYPVVSWVKTNVWY